MEVALVTAGSRGDVEPYLALGEALAERGHAVRLLAPAGFEALFEGSPVRYRPVGLDPRTAIGADALARIFHAGGRGLRFVRELIRAYEEATPAFLEGISRELKGAELVVFGSLGMAAWHWAEARGVPAVAAFLQPLLPTRAFPAPIGPWPRALSRFGAFNRLTYWIASLLAWQLVRRSSGRYRRRLGLKPLGLLGPLPRMLRSGVPVLFGFSEAVVPRLPDWPERFAITGYWRRSARDFRPPEALVRFLEAGGPVVYVGFGSMRPPDPGAFFAEIRRALKLAGVRAVLARGWAGAPVEAGDDLFVLDEIPHAWLFPRVAAAVHHGGAGTSAAVFASGVPGVWVPFIADQFFWAERARALGVAPLSVPARRLDARALAAAIRAALEPGPRAAARALAERLSKEDGAARAAAVLEER